jgi:pyrimidine-nucleoside phosphorylase
MLPYRILERKRAGMRLSSAEVAEVVRGASDGSWGDAQLGAFLMAAAIRGLDAEETVDLTRGMLESGTRWGLKSEVPSLSDKHSTGGVGDKVSIPLAPLVASCGLPMAMLTGRSLGHTSGTADKLETIPGLDLHLDRRRTLELLELCGVASGIATPGIAPADRRLYALRDATATVSSLPLITASILSKKLALGAGAVVFDVKTGNGAFLPELSEARELAAMLVRTADRLGGKAGALVTDMSQPLGRWAGHTVEILESIELLEGRGAPDLVEVTFELALEAARLVDFALTRGDLEEAIASGRARERFDRWAALQGASTAWLRAPTFSLAPVEKPLLAERSGSLAAVDVRQIGLSMVEAGGGRPRPEAEIDAGVSLHLFARLGDRVERGDELARLYLRQDDERLARQMAACFTVADEASAPPLIAARVPA